MGGQTASGSADAVKGVYSVSYNAGNENLDKVQDYQFLGSNFSGILQYDTRFYIDLKLDLDVTGRYKLTSDAYCVENGKRAEIGDETGLGQNINLVAEGTYVVNEDGTVTTAVPEHAVFVMETDTYSVQMKGAVGMNVGGNDADGTMIPLNIRRFLTLPLKPSGRSPEAVLRHTTLLRLLKKRKKLNLLKRKNRLSRKQKRLQNLLKRVLSSPVMTTERK